MAEITAAMIKDLRERTGAGMADCKKALQECDADMEKAIENARKPDCRTAYKDLGLLAVVPLVANEFGEGTCRW